MDSKKTALQWESMESKLFLEWTDTSSCITQPEDGSTNTFSVLKTWSDFIAKSLRWRSGKWQMYFIKNHGPEDVPRTIFIHWTTWKVTLIICHLGRFKCNSSCFWQSVSNDMSECNPCCYLQDCAVIIGSSFWTQTLRMPLGQGNSIIQSVST